MAQKTISGSVTGDGESLPGVSIIEKGTANGGVTDLDGKYSISVSDDAILVFSFIGYHSQEVEAGTQSIVDIDMQADIQQLDEIVVVGYGTKKKSDLTGSIGSVGSEDFEKQPMIKASDALQGRIAGVNVTNTSGAPGGAPKIRIRGNNSLTRNSEPLIIVDGFFAGSSKDLITINPNDIESMQVLKDASATALYGSRGANGVILITTKRGRSDKPVVSFNTSYGLQQMPKKIDLFSSAEFANEKNRKRSILGQAPAFSAAEISALEAGGGTDWQDEIYQSGSDAAIQDYQISVAGKSGKTNYFLSSNYAKQDGIIINTGYKRFSLRSNLNFDISKKLNIGLNVYGTREEGLNNDVMQGTVSPVASALASDPTMEAIDPVTGYPTVTSIHGFIGTSPLYRLLRQEKIRYSNTINGNLRLRYKIIDGLTYTFRGGIRFINVKTDSFTHGFGTGNDAIGDFIPPNGSIEHQDMSTWQHTNMLEYAKEIDKHNFSVKAIFEEQYESWEQVGAVANQISKANIGLYNLGLSDIANQSVYSAFVEKSLRSYLGRIDYTFNSKYLFTATARYDQSSVFPTNNQGALFPSLALGWRMSEEDFIQNLGVFSNLKLRGSWGITGSQAVDANEWRGTVRSGGAFNAILDDQSISTGVAPGVPTNPNLKWEETAQWNVGIDFGLLDSRLNFTADYYVKETTDLLLNVPVPFYSGLGIVRGGTGEDPPTRLQNVGSLENKGFEFDVNAFILEGEFKWDASFNIAFNKTKILDLGGFESVTPGATFGGGQGIGPAVILEVGKEVGNFQGHVFEGIYQQGDEIPAGMVPGDSKFKKDADGNNAVEVVGNGQPDYVWGLTNNFSYKGIELNIFIHSMGGFDVWNLTRGYTFGNNTDARDATSTDILDQWSTENTSSQVPIYSDGGEHSLQSSRWIEDGTFIRLKNVNLGYNLPSSILEKTRVFTGLKVYVSAQNLLTLTSYEGYDPEISSNQQNSRTQDIDQSIDWGSYPNPRVFTVGINAKF